MAERSWFFNAEQTGEDEYDRVYLAEDFAKYFSLFISNGVFPNPSTGLQVLAQTVPNMTVTLKPGFAFINGYGYENTSDYVFTIDTADGVLNREDSIFIRWYLTDRKIAAYKAVGTPGAEASHVDLIRTEDYWDLCVARITVKAGVTSITQSAITDTRLNTDLCGIVATLVDQVDTTTLYNQIQADLEEFQNVSEEDFTAWYQQQQQMFTEWYQQQQQMFNTWYQEQQSDFDEWFDDINAKLGTEPATALQQQIDEINTTIETRDDVISTYQHVKSGTEHMFIGSGSNGKVKMTADIASGDKVVISSAPKEKITVEGATSQPGSGDPSPDNIRMIDGVGMYDKCVVLDGSENWEKRDDISAQNGALFSVRSPLILGDVVDSVSAKSSYYLVEVVPTVNDISKSGSLFAYTDGSGEGVAAGDIYIRDPSFKDLSSLKSYLSAHPLTVWYRSVDFYKSKGPFYYVHEVSDGTESPYKAIGIELNAPLFDGDSLEIGGPSGFDQMVVLDGSSLNSYSGSPNTFFHDLSTTFASVGVIGSKSNWAKYKGTYVAADELLNKEYAVQPAPMFGSALRRLVVKLTECEDIGAAKSYLSTHPLIVFYKSVNYTPEADIAVALESCKSFYKTFDGTEEFTLAYSGEEANEYDLVLSAADTILTTSSDDNASCSHFKKGNTAVDGNWQASSTGSNVTIQFFRSKTDCPNVSSFKQWLQEEYENGTPVQCIMNRITAVAYAYPIQSESLPAYYGTEDFVTALAGEPVTDKWLTFTNDGTQLNFKGGGGVGVSKLAATTAVPADVVQGKTFYSKDKTLKTGTLALSGNAGAADVISGKTFYTTDPKSKATGTLQDLGYEPKGNGCTLYQGDIYIYFGNQNDRYALSRSVHYPQGDIINSLPGGNRGNWGTTLNMGGSATVPQGYHNGGGVVRARTASGQGSVFATANGSNWANVAQTCKARAETRIYVSVNGTTVRVWGELHTWIEGNGGYFGNDLRTGYDQSFSIGQT